MGARQLQEPGLFDAPAIGRMALRNRLAVAPMTRVSAGADGRANAAMRDYYAAFADGGFGLVITEGIYTDAAFSQEQPVSGLTFGHSLSRKGLST